MFKRKASRWLHAVFAVFATAGLIVAVSRPIGAIPALGSAFNPYTGVWTDLRADERQATTKKLQIPELQQVVQIVFEPDGTPHIRAETDHDAWVALGYLHASFRLNQMDLMRRQGSGRLSEIAGRSSLPSDRFQRQLGLAQNAQRAWDALPADSESRKALTAYASGVNRVIEEKDASHTLPFMFKLAGYRPEPWQPQDSIIISEVLAQMMSLSKMPVYYSLWANYLGYDRMMELFPVLPPNVQHPFAENPDVRQADPVAGVSPSEESPDTEHAKRAASEIRFVQMLDELPKTAVHEDSNSNAWAVDGTKTKSGKPLMAGDPHLDYSTPSIWFQADVAAPSYKFSGATVPGLPFALIGRNNDISWTLTSGQNQQTFYYEEKTDAAHPDQYYWQGEWRKFSVRNETIAIKGGGVETIEIKSSVHGPIVTQEGVSLSLHWLGTVASNNTESFLKILKAASFDDFKEALRSYTSPIMNFLYADSQNIGIITAGRIPLFPPQAKPWIPMPGTGENDSIGSVPFDENPQALNPDQHIIGTANQRQAGKDYPYYLGTTAYFDPGYRANRIYDVLSREGSIDMDRFIQLQHDTFDPLASAVVPVLLQSLAEFPMDDTEKAAADELRKWNFEANESSSAASIWWMFWENYLHGTFDPWWEAYHVPVDEHPKLDVSSVNASLTANLEQWTLHDPENHYFSNPLTGEKRAAKDVMLQAFRKAVKELRSDWGNQASQWEWGKLHTREFPAMSGIRSFGIGPKGSGGDLFSLDSAGVLRSVHGPTWRMVVDWGTGQSIGIYPGGQSENPNSAWYTDRIDKWWNKGYNPMISGDEAMKNRDHSEWTLSPGGSN